MAATRTLSIPVAPRQTPGRVALLRREAARAVGRTRAALASIVDGAQLGPGAHVTTSRWTGARI